MTAAQARFAQFVATLGRGPGRSRALTRAEAREAFALVLHGAVDPVQLGAFLMLLRYRGEDADEITGLVEAARDAAGLPAALPPPPRSSSCHRRHASRRAPRSEGPGFGGTSVADMDGRVIVWARSIPTTRSAASHARFRFPNTRLR